MSLHRRLHVQRVEASPPVPPHSPWQPRSTGSGRETVCQLLCTGWATRQLTYRQPAQNGVLTDQLCRAIYCIHLSTMPMQTAITIT